MVEARKETATLRDAEAALMKAAAARDVERALSHFADDAVILPPNAPAIRGTEAIRALMTEAMGTTGFAIRTRLTQAEVSHAGDLGYTLVTYVESTTGPDSKANTESGRVVRIWKKQPDGRWKVTVEIMSADHPPHRKK